jgi:hypothetical protein
VTRIQNKDLILEKERKKRLKTTFFGNLVFIFYNGLCFLFLSWYKNKMTLIENSCYSDYCQGEGGSIYMLNSTTMDDASHLVLDISSESSLMVSSATDWFSFCSLLYRDSIFIVFIVTKFALKQSKYIRGF